MAAYIALLAVKTNSIRLDRFIDLYTPIIKMIYRKLAGQVFTIEYCTHKCTLKNRSNLELIIELFITDII